MTVRRGRSKRARMADVAKHANVSPMTVSSVLSGGGGPGVRVGADTAERVRKAARELGYRPNLAAQQLTGKSSRLIGVVAQDWFHSVPLRILSWMSNVANGQNFRVINSQTNAQPDALAEYLHECESRGVDGVIYLAWQDDAVWGKAAELFTAIPRVVSLWGDPGIPHAHVVLSDFAEASSMSVQHVYQRGRRRIVQVLEDLDTDFNRKRRDGVIAGFEACGLPFTNDAICIATKDWVLEDPRYDDLIEELVIRRKTDAILGDHDNGAIMLMNALRRRGLTPGKDVAFVGWGNELHSGLTVPSLTTVRLRLDLLCEHAFRLVSAPREGDDVERVVVPADLVVGQSS